MTVYLDSMIVIYLVEGPDPFRTRARDRVDRLVAAGDQIAINELTRLECRVKPIRLADVSLLADYDAFFAAPDLLTLSLPGTVFERATVIRAQYGFGLATAVEHACGRFLTNDVQLRLFPDIAVEILA
jgi:predicted nucleic acid-binding protein